MRLLRALFVVHSAASVAYEIVWIKLVDGRLGMSAAALGTVLATFILGLAVGSALAAQRPLRNRYSNRQMVIVAEVGLAFFSLILPFTLSGADHVYTLWAPPTETLWHHALRGFMALVVLFPSSLCMGLVFPLLSDEIENRSSDRRGRGLTRLYRDGLIASALGSCLLPAILIGRFGLVGANTCLALVSAGVACGAATLFPVTTRPLSSVDKEVAIVHRPLPLWATSFFLGACLFIVEITGGQFVHLVINDTFYTNGILVGMVLMMMAAGATGFTLSRKRFSSSRGPVAIGCGLFALSLLAWMVVPSLIQRVYDVFVHFVSARRVGQQFFFDTSLLVFLVLGGPCVAAGFAYSACCAWAAETNYRTREAIGLLSAFNYAGSMAGALAATFFIIPRFGMTATVFVCVALMAAAFFALHEQSWSSVRSLLIWGSFVLVLCSEVWVIERTPIGVFDLSPQDHERLLFHYEDPVGITDVSEDTDAGDLMLFSNRLRMEGSTQPGEDAYKRIQGLLPVLLHPSAKDLLVIGLGTGASLVYNLTPAVDHLSCIEYNPGIVGATAFFKTQNRGVLFDPRVAVIHQDGRNFIKLTHAKYDLIIQDLFFPYQTGVGNLYTADHYRQVRDHLKPGGRCAQWLPLHQIGPEELKSLVKTFQSVFPCTSLWLDGRFLLLYGGLEPLHLDWLSFKNNVRQRSPGSDPYDLLSLYVSGDAAVSAWSARSVANTDDNLEIELRTPLIFDQLDSSDLGFRNSLIVAHLMTPTDVPSENMSPGDRQKVVSARLGRLHFFEGLRENLNGNLAGAMSEYLHACTLNPEDYQIKSFIAGLLVNQSRETFLKHLWGPTEALDHQALTFLPDDRDALFITAQAEFSNGQTAESLQSFHTLLTLYPNYYQARIRWGERLAFLKKDQEAAKQFLFVAEHLDRSVESRFDLANCLMRLGNVEAAKGLYQDVLRLDSAHTGARVMLASLSHPK